MFRGGVVWRSSQRAEQVTTDDALPARGSGCPVVSQPLGFQHKKSWRVGSGFLLAGKGGTCSDVPVACPPARSSLSRPTPTAGSLIAWWAAGPDEARSCLRNWGSNHCPPLTSIHHRHYQHQTTIFRVLQTTRTNRRYLPAPTPKPSSSSVSCFSTSAIEIPNHVQEQLRQRLGHIVSYLSCPAAAPAAAKLGPSPKRPKLLRLPLYEVYTLDLQLTTFFPLAPLKGEFSRSNMRRKQ